MPQLRREGNYPSPAFGMGQGRPCLQGFADSFFAYLQGQSPYLLISSVRWIRHIVGMYNLAQCGDMISVRLPFALFLALTCLSCADFGKSDSAKFDDTMCSAVKSAVVASLAYEAFQIAGCDGGQSKETPNFYVLRLNGYCREEICGSVLLGWYAVDLKSGRVFEWDVGEMSLGKEVTPRN